MRDGEAIFYPFWENTGHDASYFLLFYPTFNLDFPDLEMIVMILTMVTGLNPQKD
jgi:hypothetical protein